MENKVHMEMDNSFYLIGLLNEFMNRFQTKGDTFFQEISWKQCFAMNCIRLFEHAPTINELSQLVGSSHQNVKQLLNKLVKIGFVEIKVDSEDKRKQRLYVTEKGDAFGIEHDAGSQDFMMKLFKNVDPKLLQITINTISQMDENLKEIRI